MSGRFQHEGRRVTVAPRAARGALRSFSMVETVFCVVLVSGLVVASLDTVGASMVAQRGLADQSRGSLLASALLSEIMSRDYFDPNETPDFGTELSENPLSRSGFDDVDDYVGWTASPPQNRDGTVIAGLTGWRQTVGVIAVDPANLNTKRVLDGGVKRITVTITRTDGSVVSLVGVKTGTPQSAVPK